MECFNRQRFLSLNHYTGVTSAYIEATPRHTTPYHTTHHTTPHHTTPHHTTPHHTTPHNTTPHHTTPHHTTSHPTTPIQLLPRCCPWKYFFIAATPPSHTSMGGLLRGFPRRTDDVMNTLPQSSLSRSTMLRGRLLILCGCVWM